MSEVLSKPGWNTVERNLANLEVDKVTFKVDENSLNTPDFLTSLVTRSS